MSAIHIRNVPDVVIQHLKQRAKANNRSMQKEVLSILEAAIADQVKTEPWQPIKLVMAPESTNGSWRREDLYNEDGR